MKYKVIKIGMESKWYPDKLKKIASPPKELFCLGNLELFHQQSIAIIGSRCYSTYGQKAAIEFAYQLSKSGVCIVSGFARGIDSFAHESCIKAKGNTIAVLGSGMDVIYPYENRKLYDEILEHKGLIISEFELGTQPQKQNFPTRNRIISGLSDGVLVIEARKKSGTNITVDFALEQGKDVYVIPGSIYAATSDGTNFLIKEGAIPVTSYQDILDDLKQKKELFKGKIF